MTRSEANKILSLHLMQCGMMMPVGWLNNHGEGSDFMKAYEMAMDSLKNDPVKCKDCKHLMFSDCYGECRQGHLGIVKPDDFCSYGERKDNA